MIQINDIIKLLSINEPNLKLVGIEIKEDIKYVIVEKEKQVHICPKCNTRLVSKGIYKRDTRHPLLIDGYKLVVRVLQRRYRCKICNYSENDTFNFVDKYKQLSNLIPYYILYTLKSPNITASDAARQFNVSATYVYYVALRYLDIERIKLPEYLYIDEVYLNLDKYHKYALVLMDFKSKKIIDVVISRRQIDLDRYFLSIPIKERRNVKYLISDMYKPYYNLSKTYLDKAVPVIDSFHLINYLNQRINTYINEVSRRYKKKDEQRLKEKNYRNNDSYKTILESDEVYILRKFRFALLANDNNLNYLSSYYEKRLLKYTNTYMNIDMFLKLDKHFPIIKTLKSMYIDFNSKRYDSLEDAEIELDNLIAIYKRSNERIFEEFSMILNTHKKEIINSFTYLDERRLSNGVIEGFNHIIKDFKRNARGFKRFDYVRNRILWSNRDDIKVLGNPKKLIDVLPSKHSKKDDDNN